MKQELRERLAASVGGKANLASMYSARTFSDLNKRAEREIEDAAQSIEQALERIAKALAREKLEAFAEPTDELVDRAIRAWAAYQHAGSRVLNWMVTGPARFPVRSNEKRMDSEHKRLGEYLDLLKLAPERAVKRAQRAQKEALGPVGVVNVELADLKARLAHRESDQMLMKAVNEIIRREKLKAGDGAVLAAFVKDRGFNLSEALCAKILVPPYQGASIGFASYSLSNNNAEIHRLRDRVAQVERKAERVEEGEQAERVVNGVRVVEDALDDRLRLHFDGKPAPDVIALLKSRGFRWSPRNSAWQRQLTQNARYAADGVLKQMEGIAA
jgi:hypothetical protein